MKYFHSTETFDQAAGGINGAAFSIKPINDRVLDADGIKVNVDSLSPHGPGFVYKPTLDAMSPIGNGGGLIFEFDRLVAALACRLDARTPGEFDVKVFRGAEVVGKMFGHLKFLGLADDEGFDRLVVTGTKIEWFIRGAITGKALKS